MVNGQEKGEASRSDETSDVSGEKTQACAEPQNVALQDVVPCLLSLRAIRKGQKARIARVQARGELGRRIRDMGLIPGTEVEVVGRAPLRDPVALRLPGFTLSLRNNEADFILVELV